MGMSTRHTWQLTSSLQEGGRRIRYSSLGAARKLMRQVSPWETMARPQRWQILALCPLYGVRLPDLAVLDGHNRRDALVRGDRFATPVVEDKAALFEVNDSRIAGCARR